MTIEASIFTALGPLVSNRVYPVSFPLTGAVPVWPAIRYTFISVVPTLTICGDGGDETADTRVQIDAVATTFSAARALRTQIMTAMRTFYPPAEFETSNSEDDPVTKTYRERIDFVIRASSPFTT